MPLCRVPHRVLILLGLAVLGCDALPGAEPVAITRPEVAAYRDAHLAEWQHKLVAGQSRLFFTEAEWGRKIAEILAGKGRMAELRQSLREAADRVVAAPIPTYRPPQALVTPNNTLLQASYEGWERGVGDQMVVLALAVRLFDEPAYKTKLREMVLAACRYESWGRQGSHGELRDMDLAAGHVVRGISVAYDWNRSLFSAGEKTFIVGVVRTRVNRLMAGLCGGVFWCNWYTQNHNHVCAAALGLAGLAFWEDIPEAPDWLSGAMLNFQRTTDAIAEDGSSYEGLSYWAYGRSAILQFIEGTQTVTDSRRFYAAAGLKNAIAHRLGSATPGLSGTVMWSDTRGSDAVGPHHILYKLASQYRDGRGQFLADHLPFAPQGNDSVAWTVLWYDQSVVPAVPTEMDYHSTVWDTATSRSGWGEGDYLLAVKAGRNSNHHTQLDAGAITLNLAGTWLLLTPGYGLGGGQEGFFDNGGKRWTFLSNATESHSTLLIDGKNQRFDPQAGAHLDHFLSAPNSTWIEVDLTQAFAKVTSVRRRIFHRRGDYVLVLDRVVADQEQTVEWLAQVPVDTRPQGAGLLVDEGRGSLSIVPLLAGGEFKQRAPRSPSNDVAPGRMITYSTSTRGADVQLVTLLRPVSTIVPPEVLQASAKVDAGYEHVEIQAGQWKDDIWIRQGAPSPFQTVSESGASAVAEGLALRRTQGKVTSLSVVNALKIELPGCSFACDRPFDADLSLGPNRDLCLTLVGTGVVPRLDGELQVFAEHAGRFETVPLGQGGLGSGRYYVARSAADAQLCRNESERALAAPAAIPFAIKSGGPQPPAPAAAQVAWEAETDVHQHHALATIAPDRTASRGAALMSFGTTSKAHTVSWTVTVPASGTYCLRLRYAVGQPVAGFMVTVDGALPSLEAKNGNVPGPKGWGSEREWTVRNQSWREAIVCGPTGLPLLLPLTKGTHEIGLAYPTEGMNLDTLCLVGAKSAMLPTGTGKR